MRRDGRGVDETRRKIDTDAVHDVTDGPLDWIEEEEDPNDMLAASLSRLQPSLASDIDYDMLPPPSSSLPDSSPISTARPSTSISPEDQAIFARTILASPCPKCENYGTLEGDEMGTRCVSCHWGMEMSVLDPLSRAFIDHPEPGYVPSSPCRSPMHRTDSGVSRDPRVHVPILTWNEWIGSIVLCNSCDESFA